MAMVARCPNCDEWCGNQFEFKTREQKENNEEGVMYWDCQHCGEQWPV